ncbi:MAG: TolC family protein [Dissulfurispiraceae bacterium]|jgi:outer membrane protein TolC|nr:TolC family protein [Dissulfurispiraceae bacterium]
MKKIYLIILAAFFAASTAYGAGLSLDECVSMALQNNSSLKATATGITVAEADRDIAKTRMLPSLRMSGGYSMLDKSDRTMIMRDAFAPGVPVFSGPLSMDNRETYGASLIVEQPIYRGGELVHNLYKHEIFTDISKKNTERHKSLLTAEVKRTYYESLREQRIRKSLEKIIESKKERLRVISELMKEGYAMIDDFLTAETDLSSSELELSKAVNREELALSRLGRIIYIDSSTKPELIDNAEYNMLAVSLEQIKTTALANRQDIKISEARIKAADEDIAMSKSGFYPKASIDGRYTRQKETDSIRPEVWSFNARVDWYLFEWGRTKSEVTKAKALKQRAEYELDDAKRAAGLEAESAWRIIKDREREAEHSAKRVATAEYHLKRALDRYSESVIMLADLIEMESSMLKEYQDYLASIDNLLIAHAQLEAALSYTDRAWFIQREIYKPDFEAITRSMAALTSGR